MVKRIVLGILAGLLILGAGALGAVAVWGHVTFSSGGGLSFDAGTITPGPNDVATVVDVDRFGATVPLLGSLGSTRLSVATPDAGAPLFVGAGPTSDVDAYVKGGAYAVAFHDGSSWTVRQVPGSLAPALPGQQAFWITQDVGQPAVIGVPESRPLTLLFMDPSGAPSGPLVLSMVVTMAGVDTLVMWFAVAAGVLLLAGIILLVLAIRARTRRGRHAAGATAVAVAATPATEAVAEEPAVDGPVVEVSETEPVIEEPVIEEPVIEEPVATDESVGDETQEIPVVVLDVEPEPVSEPKPEVAADEPGS